MLFFGHTQDMNMPAEFCNTLPFEDGEEGMVFEELAFSPLPGFDRDGTQWPDDDYDSIA
eukprot:m.70613 g.70613  ORF g.70613 m.70613 type:complete len:59 (+) comp16846_c0_seq1:104-280(+)